MIPGLLDLADGNEVALWYAPQGEGADTRARMIGNGGAALRRAPLSRTMVDRLAFRAGLPIWRALNIGAAGVAWSPDFSVPPVREARRAITVHDLAWITQPAYVPPGLAAFLNRVVPRQIAEADAIFVVSESTRATLLERFPVPAERVVVAPNAVDARFGDAGAAPDRGGLRELDLPPAYLLMVGTVEPRKNHLRVVEAMWRARPDIPLLIAGGLGWQYGPVLEALADPEVEGVVRYLGFVDDALLPQLYANAAGLIAASVEEGFDLPVLEGMAAGVPLLLSDIPVHREVARDFASHFDPHSVDAIVDGIIALVERSERDSDRMSRQQAMANRFTWQGTAERIWQTLDALR